MARAGGDGGSGRPAPLLAFVHIPKTAGTTLTSVLSANEPGARIRHGGNVFKGGGGIKHGVKFENLLDNDDGRLDGARILAGHFPLGIREHIPEDREVHYFTFLREPADRTLSHYFQIREKRGGEGAATKLELPPLPADATIEDALERGYIHDNVHTRMLSGQAEPFGEVDEEMLEQAKKNLREELVFFGLTERFDESLVLAKRRLGLRSIIYRSHTSNARSSKKATGRVNTDRPRGRDVPQDVREAAEACNRYDIELYRYAEELFGAAPELQELDFQVEVAALSAAKAEGEIDLTVPAPKGFDGGEDAWRTVLQATASSLRAEQELAAAKGRVAELNRHRQEVVEALLKIQAQAKTLPGRDADTALRAIELLDPKRADGLAKLVADPKPRTKKKGRAEQEEPSEPSSDSEAQEDGRSRRHRGGGRRRRRRGARSSSDGE
jgi:hypothetical protein